MKDLLANTIQQKVKLPKTVLDEILSQFETQIVKKGTLILEAEVTCRELYFVNRGTARTFAYTSEREVTSWFYPEGNFLTSWYSFLQQQPGFEQIQALEECEMEVISYTNLMALYNEYPEFERFGRLLAEEQLAFIDYYSRGYLFLSAKERYQLLLDYFPDIELRVKLGQIASYLGISQETLSRIRSGK